MCLLFGVSLCFFKAGRPYSLKVFCLIWVLNLLTFRGKPLFSIAGRPYSLKVFCLIWVLNLLTFGGKPLFFITGRPYSLKVFCLIWVLNLLTFHGKPLFFIAGRPYSLRAFAVSLLTCKSIWDKLRAWCCDSCGWSFILAAGHIKSNAPDLFPPPKLRGLEPG